MILLAILSIVFFVAAIVALILAAMICNNQTDALALLMDRVREFQDKTFPGQTLDGKLNHLILESKELRDAPLDTMEWADVLLIYLGSAHMQGYSIDQLVSFANEKLTICELREWHPADKDGCFHHKKP